jgi:hypothetical protein
VRAEQRHRQRGGGGWVGGAEAQAEADVQAVGLALVDGDGHAHRRVGQIDDGQPHHAGFGAAVGAAHGLVDEGDQRARCAGSASMFFR